MPSVYVDIDDCVADSGDALRHAVKIVTKGHVDLKYEHILDYDYPNNLDGSGHELGRDAWAAAHDLFSTAEFLSDVKPFPGAVDALKELQTFLDVHFITTRLHSARIPTLQWLDRLNLGPFSVHFVSRRRKHEAVSDAVVAAIEDDPVQADLYRGKGVPCYILAHPWNAAASGRCNDWPSIVESIKRQVR